MIKVLMVEDDITLCKTLTKILKLEGIDSVVASDGKEAENLLLADLPSIDVVICDVMMPNIDGYEFMKSLRKIPRYCKTPFLFATARVSKEEELKGLSMRASEYLKKPIEIATLLEAIRKYAP